MQNLSKEDKQILKWFKEQWNEGKGRTKSSLFLELYEKGMKVGDISRATQNHYSFVYGAIDAKTEVPKKEENKSDIIRALADEGKTVGEIARLTNSNYSWVHRVVKAHRG